MFSQFKSLFRELRVKWTIFWIGFWLKKDDVSTDGYPLNLQEVSFPFLNEYHSTSSCGCYLCVKQRSYVNVVNNYEGRYTNEGSDTDYPKSCISILSKEERDAISYQVNLGS